MIVKNINLLKTAKRISEYSVPICKKFGVKREKTPYPISSHIPMTAINMVEWNNADCHLTLYWVAKKIKLAQKYKTIFNQTDWNSDAANKSENINDFLADFFFSCKIERTIPAYSIPGVDKI